MEIPTDDFIKDGMISSVEIKDNNLVITWNTDADKTETKIPLTELVDVMTGVDGTTIKVDVSADDKISAEVKAGSITTSHIAPAAGIVKTQLAADVQTSLGKADTALQTHQTITTEVSDFGDNTAMVKVNGTGIHKIAGSDPITVTAAPNADLITVGLDAAATKTALGLGSAAYEDKATFATAAQGKKADSAVQTIEFAYGANLNPGEYEARGGIHGINVDGTTLFAFRNSDTLNYSGVWDEDAEGYNFVSFDIKDKGVTTAKLADKAVTTAQVADHAIGAHQTKACADYNGADAEVWVFNCGSATINV
jgi:hypothetical protein